jgi:hypothetical protein
MASLYLIDYSGTINRQKDPGRTIDRLKAEGNIVCLHSGSNYSEVEENYPGLLRRLHSTVRKGDLLSEVKLLLLNTKFDSVVVVDDDDEYSSYVRSYDRHKSLGLKWAFVHAHDFTWEK